MNTFRRRVDNLIRFCALIHLNVDMGFLSKDPEYLLEKWYHYIGICPFAKEISKVNDDGTLTKYGTWCRKWNLTEDKEDVRSIIDFCIKFNELNVGFIVQINKSPIVVSEIINLFNQNIGDFDTINDTFTSNLHPVIMNKIDSWFQNFEIRRDLNLMLIDLNFNK